MAGGNHRIKVLREIKPDDKNDKLAPQEQVIYEALVKKGLNKEIDRDAFVAELEKAGALKTKQEVRRVVAYYVQHLVKLGVVESIKPDPEPAPAKKSEPSAPGAKSPAAAEPKPAKAA